LKEKNSIIMENITRRRFIDQSTKLLAFIPLVNVIACISDNDSVLSPEDSLKKLIFIIGPWTIEDKPIAEDFAKRFLKTAHIDQYLPNSEKLVQGLAKQFSNETLAIKDIDLKKLSESEQKLLIDLSQQIHSFLEVRFYISNEPLSGECQGDPKWHTQIPKKI